MASQVRDRVMAKQRRADADKGFVLGGFEQSALQTFELDANRVVIAVAYAAKAGLACMPGARITAGRVMKKWEDTCKPRID